MALKDLVELVLPLIKGVELFLLEIPGVVELIGVSLCKLTCSSRGSFEELLLFGKVFGNSLMAKSIVPFENFLI